MAGGIFNKAIGKVRPGTYVNFEAETQNTVPGNERGIVAIPLIGHNYGPEKEFITLSAIEPDGEIARLGYSVYDEKMLVVKEAFKNASAVVVYIPKTGDKAAASGGGLTAQAKYGGSRGNDISFSISENPVNGFDVAVYLAGNKVELFESITEVSDLASSEYISFSSETTDFSETAGISLVGGTDGETTNADIISFIDGIESVHFNTVAFPAEDEALKAAMKTKIKYMRENMGRGVKAVIADYSADYEGVINVTNSVYIGGKSLTHAQATAWVAGADAAASYTQSNTYKQYEGAEGIVDVKTHEQAVAAIKNGEFFFSYTEQGNVVAEYDINSLVTVTEKKNDSYKKNRIIRVLDTFGDAIKENFPPNRYANSELGWAGMEGIGKTILKNFYDDGAIENVDYDNDFKVDRSLSKGDSTYFNVAIKPVDSAEKLYFTVSVK